MNINIKYIDNSIDLNEEKINSIEIENKGCFFRTINNLMEISNGFIIEDIYCYDNENNEINLSNNILLIANYFDMDLMFKKYSNNLQKMIINDTDEKLVNDFAIKYKNLIEKFKSSLSEIDLPIKINDEFSLEQLIKITKPTINTPNDLIKSIYLLIDLEKIFTLNKLIIFVNLKQYLSKQEISELYKYALYNKIQILLIDNQSYSTTLENERKIIIDDNLDEYML